MDDALAATAGAAAVHGQVLDDGNGEGSGFAGAGLRHAEQVAAFQQVGNALGLDGRGRGVAFLLKGFQDGLDETELVKGMVCHSGNYGN